uniref:UBA domain-containing protein n=1 Tax=Panagrellus redivivus TaxID=6233 RepID=A0A7E4V1J5_PANRE
MPPADAAIPGLYEFQSTSMFRNAPATKLWIILLIFSTLISTITDLLIGNDYSYIYTLDDVFHGKILPLIVAPFIADGIPDLTISCILLYFYRLVERRFGTKKFINCMVITYVLMIAFRIAVIFLLYDTDPSNIGFPIGPLPLMFALFFYFAAEIAILPVTMILEFIPASDHHFILLLLVQYINTYTLCHFVLPAAVSTILYRNNALYIQRISILPEFVCANLRDSDTLLGDFAAEFEKFLETKRTKFLPVAATLERQRIEEEDEYERQLFRRNAAQNVVGATAAVFGFPPTAPVVGPPPEGLITRLLDMGFGDRETVIRALRDAENNVEVAANLLIQRNAFT